MFQEVAFHSLRLHLWLILPVIFPIQPGEFGSSGSLAFCSDPPLVLRTTTEHRRWKKALIMKWLLGRKTSYCFCQLPTAHAHISINKMIHQQVFNSRHLLLLNSLFTISPQNSNMISSGVNLRQTQRWTEGRTKYRASSSFRNHFCWGQARCSHWHQHCDPQLWATHQTPVRFQQGPWENKLSSVSWHIHV